ncbi:D-ribitol-5-phosphate cytidylyltransferase [Anabrus simplex]|uniref:D-ribitol-5-phosphate cytidylyltransferase n=1 Tax=Anabrus simplex TaxID=316456 RepID=UPI0034DD7026
MISFGVGVILPSAGSGERLGGPAPKQYCKINGRPLFMYALEGFECLSWVKRIAVVVDNPEHVQGLLEASNIDREKILVVRGGQTRHRSIRAGVHALQKNDPNLRVLVVHDAVRPFVPASLVQELVLAADQHGAAGATRPLVSTVVKGDSEGFMEESLERSKYVASETPQAFQFGILSSAYSKCSEEELDHGTECLQLALSCTGVRARLIEGPEDLWKVTYKKDIYAAVGCFRERMNQVCILAPEETETVRLVAETLSAKVSTVQRILITADASHRNLKETFNTVIFFHLHEIDQDSQLLNFAAMLDVEKEGLIVHVIEHTNADGMQSMSVYDLHHSGRNMARHYEKLHKGVVVIHCLTPGEDQRLAELVTSLVLANSTTFSGQTLFL